MEPEGVPGQLGTQGALHAHQTPRSDDPVHLGTSEVDDGQLGTLERKSGQLGTLECNPGQSRGHPSRVRENQVGSTIISTAPPDTTDDDHQRSNDDGTQHDDDHHRQSMNEDEVTLSVMQDDTSQDEVIHPVIQDDNTQDEVINLLIKSETSQDEDTQTVRKILDETRSPRNTDSIFSQPIFSLAKLTHRTGKVSKTKRVGNKSRNLKCNNIGTPSHDIRDFFMTSNSKKNAG